MVLKFFNTLTRKKEIFQPLRGKVVRMYSCGLTVYNFGHIGNFRCYIFADLLRRYLEYRGYDAKHVMNFTDVGHMTQDDVADSKGQDKMEKAAEREHKTPWEIADFYIKAFLEDSRTLNLKEPEVRPKATEHIKEMQEIIKKLIENGYAYAVNGNVYFDVTKFKGYGKLSGNTINNLLAGAGGRVEENTDKKNPLDFALWINNPKHIMKWPSPWSEGYPGWHIECSAMSTKYLGDTFDIHTGGEDNMFPHHECEIAQTEGSTGKKFVNYWLHVRHLLVNGEKMSKSKGNFYTLRDLLEKGCNPMSVRYVLMSAHYRQPLDFNLDTIRAADNIISRFKEFLSRLEEADGKGGEAIKLAKKAKDGFIKAMDDDLNVSDALASIFTMMKDVNRLLDEGKVSKSEAVRIQNFIYGLDTVFGLELGKEEETEVDRANLVKLYKSVFGKEEKEVDNIISGLIEKRNGFRDKKEFKKADEIRDKLNHLGIILEDKDGKTKWKFSR